ncbi:MAG: hypothetical protein EXR76_13880 [Myxococcales bacterium]|nr:hypothetical protein [Myxococcales bacterium]
MGNFYRDNEDLRFYFERGLDWAPLVELVEQGYAFTSDEGPKDLDAARAFYADILESVGQFTAEVIAPKAALIDREGVSFKDGEVTFPPTLAKVFEEIRKLELHGMCLPRELGGQNVPLMIYMLNSEMFARAEVSVMAHHGFHGGIAMALLFFSLMEGSTEIESLNGGAAGRIKKTRFEAEIREIISGAAWGCMDITEPNAGSDMAALRTRGTLGEDGRWSVTGEKIFITSGHGKYHLVVARTEDAADNDDPFAGLKGLSMFLVPIYADTPSGRRRLATVSRIEEKLGHHGSATCAIRFEDSPAHLLGKRGEGFNLMLLLMNNARIGVAFEAIGLGEAALRLAREYASSRPSMGKNIDRHELIADYLDEMKTDLQGVRALAMGGGFAEELSQRLRTALIFRDTLPPDQLATLQSRLSAAKRRARRFTPLAKYLAGEKAVEISRLAVQIHGGVGYTKEYGAEKLLRDAMVMPIYEGTSQIQSLMAMKDTLGAIIKNPGRFVRRTAKASWNSVSARDPLERRVAKLQVLSLSAQRFLLTRTAAQKLENVPVTEWPKTLTKEWDPKRDFALAMLHAERLTRLLCMEAIAELLWEQAKEFEDRREVLERHLERAEPRARCLHEEITTTGSRLLRALEEGS